MTTKTSKLTRTIRRKVERELRRVLLLKAIVEIERRLKHPDIQREIDAACISIRRELLACRKLRARK